MMGSENMYMTNPYSKVDTFMRFEEYQRRYPYTGKTEYDRLIWLMGCVLEKPYCSDGYMLGMNDSIKD